MDVKGFTVLNQVTCIRAIPQPRITCRNKTHQDQRRQSQSSLSLPPMAPPTILPQPRRLPRHLRPFWRQHKITRTRDILPTTSCVPTQNPLRIITRLNPNDILNQQHQVRTLPSLLQPLLQSPFWPPPHEMGGQKLDPWENLLYI